MPTLEGRKLAAAAEIKLVGDRADPRTLGTKPTADCPNGRGGFKEFDGEGIAYAPPFYYVVGSHGCSRNSGKFRLSSFILARSRLLGQGC